MKNSIYLLMMFLGLALTSCEPMEDIHEEVDNRIDETPIIGVEEYTLTTDDYDALEIEGENFANLDEAGALIPGLLDEMFPLWGEGSLTQVTFNLNAPNTPQDHTVEEAGYEAVGLDRNYFTSTTEIKDYLEMQFPQARLNEYVNLTYRTVAVEQSYTFTDDDFDLVGEELETVYEEPAANAARFNSFERREDRDSYWSNEMILEAINIVMAENFTGIEGQTYEVTYDIYNGSSGVERMKIRYNGTSYEQFGAEFYEMSNADFDFIGEEFADEYPTQAGSAANFNNFDRREGNAAYWSDEMILEAVNALLMERFPDAAEETKFNVSYRVYTGSAGTQQISVVLNDGEYVINEEETISTVMTSDVFAFGDNMWHVPLTLPDGIYQSEFGQRFGNFSNESTAGFYIGRWLEPRFPYAQDGDFVSVEYDLFTGSVETRYASFVYDGEEREWEFIPTVIPYTLQFGYEDTGWVVDNTIVYTLADGDYEYIESQLIDKYPGPADSAGWFKNFDRRPGNANQWTDAMILEAMNILLSDRVAPDAEEGQKYLLVFDIYNGTNTTEQLHLIKTDGEWVPVD